MKITAELFEAFLKCPTKCWLRATGERSNGNTYAEWLKTQNQSYRVIGTKRLVEQSLNCEVAASPTSESLMATKWQLATCLTVQFQKNQSALETCIHAVERAPGKGSGKVAQFIPIRFIFTNKLSRDVKLLLAFDALVFSEAFERGVGLGKIIHGDNFATLNVKTTALMGEVRKRIEKIAAIFSNKTPADLILNRHCAECEFRDRCRQKALETDDLSLLAGMSAKERQKLRSKGIFTVTQLSYTFRPRRRPKRLRDKREKYHHSLKALAVREKKIHIVGRPELKNESTPVYLDVEGLPDLDFYYLIGVRIGHGANAVQHSLWADTAGDEAKIWREFLTILETIEKPKLIYYGSYEKTFLEHMGKRHGGPPEQSVAATALDSSINLLSFIFAQIYFPTYSNGLKEVARWLGFKWSATHSSGLQAIYWRENYETSDAHAFKEELINYNAEDCAALALVSDTIAQAIPLGNDDQGEAIPCVQAESLKNGLASRYHEFVSQIPEFRKMTEAAHWHRQRDELHLAGRKRRRRAALRTKPSLQPVEKQRFVDLSRRCPRCDTTACNKQRLRTRVCDELLFGRASLKVRRIRTVFQIYFCRSCRRHFGTLGYPDICRRYGWNLRAFFLYLIIEVNISQFAAVALLNRLFGISADRSSMNTVKKQFADYYCDTYHMIKERILSSHVLHVDETRANVQGKSAYVWVLTSLEHVFYVYSDTREGGTIQELLSSFKGVLVSDFYAVYDTVACEQQKCLIHLVRDLNDDLLANPFDDELKHLAKSFGALMKPILETTGRRGLKRHFLHKHLVFVWRFYRNLERRAFRSEVAVRWQERLKKGKHTLFTFLKYDRVPWNNNNAEHAIKTFARLRRIIAGSSTVRGLADYLVLLSIYQTCKYMDVDFLDFLCSGEKDIHAFAESRRRRKRPSTASKLERRQ